jgi:DNA-binding NtrC family response regulator
MASQVKLLRLLQEREYSPLGSDVTKISDTRILLATNLRIEELRVNEKFRRDLYYRIATHHVNIPPLRERVNDIKPLLEHFIRKASKELNKKPPSYHPELITRLKAYSFPGNIRELESMVFDAVSNHKSKMLSMKIFLSHIERNSGQINKTVTGVKPSSSIKGIFKEMEELPFIKHASNILIEEALERSEGNQSVAASMVGISPQALSARLKKIRSGQKYL